MLFKRRTAETTFRKLRNLLWPRMGFKRLYHYYKFRSIRIPASNRSIASGFAFGCLVSWTPTFGTHLIQCVIYCWLTRSSYVASFIGSLWGNPWTTPMLMLIAYHVGKALFIATGHGDILTASEGAYTSFGQFLRSILHGDVTMGMLTANFHKYLLPTLVGGYTMGLATFPLFYYPFYYMVKGARAARRLRIEKKAHEDMREITGQAE